MPVDGGPPPRPGSPNVADDKSSKRDKNFRRYVSAVERALSLFDTALQEWADYISFLGRLLKALQTRPPGTNEVPQTALVAKRLAQCLNPSLPSGVHQKTVEIYATVFAILGKDSLSVELPLYLPGLSPLLSFASLTVKPAFLSLFETFIVTLDPSTLQPALKAIFLALLPGLEEENSEEFERTHVLLNKVRSAFAQSPSKSGPNIEISNERYFWQSLFLAAITSPSRRQGALAYLDRNLPHSKTISSSIINPGAEATTKTHGEKSRVLDEFEVVISPEPGLLIRCFAAGLQDEQLLIQRGFLDLLVTHLPLNSCVLHERLVPEGLELLVSAAASVVARREMSLNRRLWVWFLGPKASSDREGSAPSSPSGLEDSGKADAESPVQYFQKYGLGPLANSLRKMVTDKTATPLVKARPFRICLSLMDRWEIGGLVVPQMFGPAMESIRTYERSALSKEAFTEVLRSANVFFDGIQSSLIWSEIVYMLLDALDTRHSLEEESDSKAAQQKLDLVWFIITKFNIREEEMLTLHIPTALLVVLSSVRILLESNTPQMKSDSKDLIQTAFKISMHLLDLVPERVFTASAILHTSAATTKAAGDVRVPRQLLEEIRKFYGGLDQNVQLVKPPISDIGSILLQNVADIVKRALKAPYQEAHFDAEVSVFDKLLKKVQNMEVADKEAIVLSLSEATSKVAGNPEYNKTFSSILGLMLVVEILHRILPQEEWESSRHIRRILTGLIMSIWTYVSPLKSRHSVEAVRCLWRLHVVSPDSQLIEGSITTLMLHDEKSAENQLVTLDGARRFASLWTHSSSVMQPSSNRRSQAGLANAKASPKSDRAYHEADRLARPLLLVLDSLRDTKTELFVFTISWLQSLPSIQIIVSLLIRCLHDSISVTRSQSNNKNTGKVDTFETTKTSPGVEATLYYLQTILNLITHCPANVRAPLGTPIDFEVTAGQHHVDDRQPDKPESLPDHENVSTTIQVYLIHVCMEILEQCLEDVNNPANEAPALRQTAILTLQQLLSSSSTASYAGPKLEPTLIKTLCWSVEQSNFLLQPLLIDLLLVVLKAGMTRPETPLGLKQRPTSRDTIRSVSQISLSTEKSDKDPPAQELSPPNPALLDSLLFGLSSPKSQPVLEHWVRFLENCLPLYVGSTFQILMPLVDCLSRSIESVFEILQSTFEFDEQTTSSTSEPIHTVNMLFNGLEQVLARGHDQLRQEEAKSLSLKTPDQVQGFFGNMVTGVFAPDTQTTRSATANNRLTILLCFKDAVRVSFKLWSWGDGGHRGPLRDASTSASFHFTSIRLRNRARRILEHLFAAEVLECLETLIESWLTADESKGQGLSSSVLNLLHALEASRPKNTMPALFNAIYSRTNPAVLDPLRKSTLTSELSDIDIASFLAAYTRSMDDDALDEVWSDCMAFSRDVLGNPLPHRQTLPMLLEFIAILGEKINNTNFGEQRRMRREIGDLFVRLLAATFTTKPLSFSQESLSSHNEKPLDDPMSSNETRNRVSHEDIVAVTASVLPNVSRILVDTDRIVAAMTTISTQILTPTLRSKYFPTNVSKHMLDILKVMSRIPEVSKLWKKDVAEEFNDSRFFSTKSFDLVETGWMPVLRQWALVDNDRMPELLSRLSAPASAGIVFGVGATSARLEADRKTQLNLRRIALLILSADDDAFVVNISPIQEKLAELMNATAASSPSSTTRGELYMVLRALILKNSAIHLASLWPIANSELHDTLSSLNPTRASDTYNTTSVLQAAKFLDTLLIVAPDDFQLREWLFVTDTIDAVYRPSNWTPVALVDELAESLDHQASVSHTAITQLADNQNGMRKPLLQWQSIKNVPQDRLVDQVLRPFLRQLSIHAFESTYQMEVADRKACCMELLHDLFDDGTLV